MRILLADDHTLFREGMRYILQDLADKLDIVEAETFDETISHLEQESQIDVVLLDLNMPGMNGLTSLEVITQKFPAHNIVVLSASEERSDVRMALQYGAKGYIPKSSNREVMVSALRLILSGGTYLPPFLLEPEVVTETSQLSDMQQRKMPAAQKEALPEGLTPRQMEVLSCLAEGKSNKEIARELELAEGTVKIHIAGILKALKVNNRTQAVIAAGKLGIAIN